MFKNIPVNYRSIEYAKENSDVHCCILNDIFRELMKLEQKQNHARSDVTEQLGGMALG